MEIQDFCYSNGKFQLKLDTGFGVNFGLLLGIHYRFRLGKTELLPVADVRGYSSSTASWEVFTKVSPFLYSHVRTQNSKMRLFVCAEEEM